MRTLLVALTFALLALAVPAVAQQPTIAGLWTADLPEGLASIDIPAVVAGAFVGTHMSRDMADGAIDAAPLDGRISGRTVTLTVAPESSGPISYTFGWDGADTLVGGPVGTGATLTYARVPRGLTTAGLAK